MVAWATGSWWTHVVLVTGADEITEAWMPRVRTRSLIDRIAELRREDRAFVVLDLKGITHDERCRLARGARSYTGRFYDVGQAVLFGLGRRFVKDGPGTLICSRLITAAFQQFLDVPLFAPGVVGQDSRRHEDYLAGECTPADLLKSILTVVAFSPSSRIRALVGT
jgi:hypothetical protein